LFIGSEVHSAHASSIACARSAPPPGAAPPPGREPCFVYVFCETTGARSRTPAARLLCLMKLSARRSETEARLARPGHPPLHVLGQHHQVPRQQRHPVRVREGGREEAPAGRADRGVQGVQGAGPPGLAGALQDGEQEGDAAAGQGRLGQAGPHHHGVRVVQEPQGELRVRGQRDSQWEEGGGDGYDGGGWE
jgi:hypothetical protein